MTDIRKKLAGKKTKLAQDRPRKDDHPANLQDCQEGSYYNLDIDLILPDPELPEKFFDQAALEELAASIRQHRLYEPIVVRRNETGQIIIVAGRRRLIAAKMAGLEKIPAIFTEGDPLEVSLIENLQRESLTPVEDTKAIDVAPPAIREAIEPDRLPEAREAQRRRDNFADMIEERRKSELLAELQNLVKIIDGIITDGK
jgi:ParB family chromosome partitioning protein